jgi:PhnB protein
VFAMAKRSLAEQFDDAVGQVLASPNASRSPVDKSLEPLFRVAAKLRHLPRPQFKASLKSDLQRRTSVATVAEPIAAVHTTAMPRMTFKNVANAIEFYKNAFGARETFRFELGGGIAHAEITVGDSPIHLSEEWPEGGRFSAERLGQSPIQLSLQVADVDSFAAHAVAAGLNPLGPISDKFYGRREGSFIDPFGYTWNISTIKEKMSVEEMHRRLESEQKAAIKPVVAAIPKGFRTITPYMIAKDGPGLLEFAKEAFRAEELSSGTGSAGGLHAEIKIGDSIVMIGGGIPGREFRSTASTIALHVYVKDVDAVYERALAAGATSVHKPIDQEYGERSAGLQDAAGNYWYVATHQGPSYVPEGLNDVNVYMHPLRADPMIKFLTRAFGAQELEKYASPDGVVQHAKVRLGTSILEMGEAHGPYQPTRSTLYVYVPDVDAAYRRAVQAGATSISAPANQPYGDRNAGVKDPFGNTWFIASRIQDA